MSKRITQVDRNFLISLQQKENIRLQKKAYLRKKMYYKAGTIKTLIDSFKAHSDTFTLSFTGYTALIKNHTQKTDYFCIKENCRSPFEVTQKIKASILGSEIYVDKIFSHSVKYFSMNNIKDCQFKEVYNIDINNAYPTSLKKLGFIDSELFNYLDGLDKITRLKAIGQIATKKTVFEFINGQQNGLPYIKENELLRNVWFAICQDVGETIDLCRKKTDSFLFFWFDGIYFSDKSEAEKITKIIEDCGYKCKFEILKTFKVKQDEKNYYISYKKVKDTKTFTLPKSEKVIYS